MPDVSLRCQRTLVRDQTAGTPAFGKHVCIPASADAARECVCGRLTGGHLLILFCPGKEADKATANRNSELDHEVRYFREY